MYRVNSLTHNAADVIKHIATFCFETLNIETQTLKNVSTAQLLVIVFIHANTVLYSINKTRGYALKTEGTCNGTSA